MQSSQKFQLDMMGVIGKPLSWSQENIGSRLPGNASLDQVALPSHYLLIFLSSLTKTESKANPINNLTIIGAVLAWQAIDKFCSSVASYQEFLPFISLKAKEEHRYNCHHCNIIIQIKTRMDIRMKAEFEFFMQVDPNNVKSKSLTNTCTSFNSFKSRHLKFKHYEDI